MGTPWDCMQAENFRSAVASGFWPLDPDELPMWKLGMSFSQVCWADWNAGELVSMFELEPGTL